MAKRKSGDEVDIEFAKRGVWLVKVPKYLSELWEANSGTDVGRLQISQGAGKNGNVKLRSRPGLKVPESLAAGPTSSKRGPTDGGSIPQEHTFNIGDLNQQSLVVLAEDKTGMEEEASITSGSLSVEGRVVKKAECRPPENLSYLKMKISQIEKCSQPKKHVIVIDKAAVKFKPVSVHAEDMARMKLKKDGAKTVRIDKDVLRQQIFMAFEKHQYYRLQDLQQLTNQPANYVKEVLNDIAVYNAAPPHKSMWELKNEYRSYNSEQS